MTAASGETENEMTDVNNQSESELLPEESFESQGQEVKTQKTISFLTLGDGDFTYSLDLARYLASTKTDEKYVVSASGVDTREELMSKYKDAPFVLKQLVTAASMPPNSCSVTHNKLTVHIRHGINAIVMPSILVQRKGREEDFDDKCSDKHTSESPITPTSPGSQSPSSNEAANWQAIQPADHVMFHHPHLATEDAVLHQRFLCHLFHTVNHIWLAEHESKSPRCEINSKNDVTGSFHLTLVKGQAERWKCLETAKDQGFELVWRGPFVPPPPPLRSKSQATTKGGEIPFTTTYQLRRHQTGKSFASRRPEWQSESLIFQRRQGRKTVDSIQNPSILPWDIANSKEGEESIITEAIHSLENAKAKISHQEESKLKCQHCDKVFREERSLKCHLKAKHAALLPQEDNDDDCGRRKRKKRQKRKGEIASLESLPTATVGATNSWHCPHQCKGLNGELRTFISQEALQSHIVAKHSGLHQSISPDWKLQSLDSPSESIDPESTLSATNRQATPTMDQTKELDYGHCKICGWRFETKEKALQHIHDFTPPSTVLSFSCRFCSKVFREKRAQLQHENFCSHRNKNIQG